MTTTSTATITRLELIKRAYRRCGIDYPTPDRINLGVALLNDILKEIDSEGRWLWAINPTPSAFTTVSGRRYYGAYAELTVQDLLYTALATGGTAITIAYTGGGVAGAEVVTVVGSAISVQIQSGVSTATQVAAAIAAFPAAAALVSVSVAGTSTAHQVTVAAANLVSSFALSENILRLEWVEIVQGTSRRPLRIIYEKEALNNIQRESPGGQPYFVYLELASLQINQRMHFFPTPNSGYLVNYNFQRRLYDFGASTDNPDMPADWNQRLAKRLAAELAPELRLPLDERQLLRAESDEAMHTGKSTQGESTTPVPRLTQFF